MHLTLSTAGGGPLWAHMALGCGYVTTTWGSSTPDWNRTGSECTEGPHPHQHNMPLPDRTNYTPCTLRPTTTPCEKQARITSQPDCSVCIYSQGNGSSVARDV